MEFRILGPLEVRDDGHLVELRRHKQRALLAILLLHANEWLSADALIEALWGERSPKTARAALQGYIAQLRRALGQVLIVSREGGYRLEIEPEQLDLSRFEDLVERARSAEPKERLARLREALALWRGPPLADLVYEPFADADAARLDDLRAAALEELMEAELLLGAGPTLVERLEALVGEHPYRERLRGQLMLALYRSGRQVEALECFREARSTMVDELGVEPGAALQELQQLILRQDAALEAEHAELQASLPPVGRRKTVTVLFVELSARKGLDPEVLRDLDVAALTTTRDVLERHGATVEQWGSDELMAVFGLPLAHEDDALRAARAALELQVAVDAVAVRVGIESGEVIAGIDAAGHGFFAGAVVAAARHLLESAPPGTVLLGDAAERLLGSNALTERLASGAETAARVLSRVEARQQVASGSPFVDRLDELAALSERFADVAWQRQPRLVLVLGEAGIGKTRLADEFCTRLDETATIARGRCLSYGQGLTYWPLVEALRELGEPAAEALEQLTAGGATSPQQLAWRVGQALERAAATRPLLVLVEDLHWAEAALLELLELLIAVCSEARILLLCLARPELLERYPHWAQQETVRLAPLSRPDAEALLGSVSEPLAADKRTQVLARGAGNPLFLEELSAFVAAGGRAAELPPRIQVLLQARLDLLPESQRRLLATAALEGTVFHRGALEALLPEEPRAGLTRDLNALGQALLIRPASPGLEHEQGYQFRHQLIRDTAYGALPKDERAQLHERFADWLGRHTGSRTELADIGAYHLEQSALTRRDLQRADSALDARAAEALAAAAERARLRTDLRAAAGLWRRALALLPEDDSRIPELELELGLVLAPLGEARESRRLLEHAEQRVRDPSTAAAVRLALLFGRLHFDPEGTPAAVRRECEQAIPLFERRGDHRALGRAWHTLATADVTELQMQAAAAAYSRAAEHAHLAGDRALEALALAERIGFLTASRLSFSAGVRELERLAARFPGEPPLEAGLLEFRAADAYQQGRREEGRALARRAASMARRYGYALFAGAWTAAAAELELLWGDVEEAERLALSAMEELEGHHERGHLSWAQTIFAEIRNTQGRFEEALELADEAERVGGPHDRGTLGAADVVRARAFVHLGNAARAKAAAARAVSVAERSDSLLDRARAKLALAQVLAAANQRAAALTAAEEADRVFTALDRTLQRRRVAALVAEIEAATAMTGAPA